MFGISIDYLAGALIGGFVITGAVSRLYRWLARKTADRLARALVPNFLCLLTCASLYGLSGLGGDYMHTLVQGLALYGIPQAIWVVIDLVSPAKPTVKTKASSVDQGAR